MSLHQPLLQDNRDFEPPAGTAEIQRKVFERIISSINDFVLFLRDLYIPEAAIQLPPADGWPEITKESWASFQKSDEVIEVLRHLTYIKSYVTGDAYEFLPHSGLYDFRHPERIKEATSGNGRLIAFMTERPGEPEPPYVVGLIGGGRACRIVLLDCRNGIVYGEGTYEGGWTEGVRRPVEEYFAILKNEFRQMRLLPRGRNRVSQAGHELDAIFSPLKEIYRRHGWPDNYRRDECVAELAEFGDPKNICRLRDEYLRTLHPP